MARGLLKDKYQNETDAWHLRVSNDGSLVRLRKKPLTKLLLQSLLFSKPKNFVSQGGRVLKSIITKSLLVALLAAVVTPVTNTANAQDEKGGGLVAVLDVAKVFKDCPAFETKMAAIKSEADGLKTQIEQQMAAIQAEAQELDQFVVNSPERNSKEATLEQKQTSLRTKARQAEADLLTREAKIYYETYQQMEQVVSGIANQYGISLVIRFDSEEIDSNDRAEVIKGVNRAVVFHRQLDLTNLVIKQMNPGAAQATTGTQTK